MIKSTWTREAQSRTGEARALADLCLTLRNDLLQGWNTHTWPRGMIWTHSPTVNTGLAWSPSSAPSTNAMLIVTTIILIVIAFFKPQVRLEQN